MSVSSGDEWEMISNALIKDQDEAIDFLARPGSPGEEVSAELQAKNDLQDTIKDCPCWDPWRDNDTG